MPEYFYNNKPLPEWQILEAAEEEDMSLEEFLESMPDITVSGDGLSDLPEGEFDLDQLYDDEDEDAIRPQKFSHIQPEEFEELSATGWWDREGKIVGALEEQYEFDLNGNKSGIQFKTANIGGVDLGLGQDKEANAVEVILPGQDKGKIFNLYHSDNKAKMQAEYTNITEYIESQKRKPIKSEFKEKIHNVINSRKQHDKDGKYVDYETRLAMNPNIKDDSGSFYDDEDVASDLSLVLDAAGVEVKEETIFTAAVSLKLESGAKRTFNLQAEDVADRMIHFLESDPRGYKQTKKYKEEVIELQKVVGSYLKGYKEDYKKGLLLTGGNAKTLKTKIMNDLGSAGWQQLFFADKEQLQNLTEDEKLNLIQQSIDVVVDNASKIKGRVDAKQEILDLKESGKATNDEEIFELIKNQVSKGFGDENSLQNQIFKLNEELDDPDITPERRDTIVGNEQKGIFGLLPQKRHLLEEEESSIWTKSEGKNYYTDPVTLERSLSSVTEEDIAYEPINRTDGVNDQMRKLKDEKLTRKQLKHRWTIRHLSHNQFMDDWGDKKQKFFIDPKKRQGFLEKFPDVTLDKDGYATATDEHARRNEFWFNPEGDANHIARMQYGINLKDKVDALDKMYAMNEDVKSQKQATWYAATGESIIQSFSDKSYEFKYGTPTDQFRQTFLSEMESMGVQPTAEEKEYAKSTTGEVVGSAVGIIPKIGIDFWLANKAIALVGAATGINRLLTGVRGLGGLKGKHFEVGGKVYTREQLVTHITAKSPKWFTIKTGGKLVEGGVYGQRVPKLHKLTPGSIQHDMQIAKWVRVNKATKVKPPISSRIKDHAIGANLEGIKMEIAMQDPSGAILTAIGAPSWREESELPEWGESYATGVGFYAANFMPLHKLVNKSSAWKGLFDKLVAAPINFTMASKIGGFVNTAVEDMRGSTTWSNFLEEEYGDYDEMMKHIISDLAMGVGMSLHKFNQFDSPFFITGGRGKKRIIMGGEEGIEKLKRVASIKKEALYEKHEKNVYERDENGKIKKDKNGKRKILAGHKKGDIVFEIDSDGNIKAKRKKGVKQEDIDKHSALISMANERLALIKDTQEYRDPVLATLKLLREHDGVFEAMRKEGKDVEPQYHYDVNQSQRMSHKVVKPGERLRNGKENKTGKEVHEMVFNPKLITPGLAPHELGHVGFHTLFGEDVLFKTEFLNGIIEIAKKTPMPDSNLSLYETLLEKGIWKEGNKYTMAKVKEWDLFSYIAEFLADGNTMKKIREQYGLPVENNVFDRLANLLQTTTIEKLKIDSNFDTQKEIVEWFGNYIETVGEGKGFVGQMKHLEKWISRAKTENQRKRREAGEGFIEQSMQSEVLDRLQKDRADLKEQLKGNPFLPQVIAGEITQDKYKEKTKKITDQIKEVENKIKDISTRFKEQDVLATENIDAKFQNELQGMYENPIHVKGTKITSKSDKAYFIAEKYNPINNSNPGAAVLAGKLKMFDNKKRPNFKLNREIIIEDITVGGVPKPKIKGEGFKKDRSIRQLILEYDPTTKDTNKKLPNGEPNPNYGKQIPLTGYIGKAMWGPKGSVGKGRGVKESVDYFAPDVTTGKVKKAKEAIEAKTVVYGDMKAKVELPISEIEFERVGGWRETIERRAQKRSEQLDEAGYKDLPGLTPELIQKIFNVKLSESQKKNLNDLGETNLRNLQEVVNSKFAVEEVITKDGIAKEREVLVVESIKDLLSNGTVETAAAVIEKLRGTSTGVADSMLHPDAKLYHLATPKNYTEAELLYLGFTVQKTPGKDKKTGEEYWRMATPAGGRVFIKGPAKGKEIKNEDLLRYVGIENTYKDGEIVSTKYTPLEPAKGGNRSLAGHGRRLMDAMDQVITNQVTREGVKDGIITVPGAIIANVLFNLGSGRSRKIFSQVLEKELETLDQKREFFKGINSHEFNYIYDDYLSRKNVKNPLGQALRDYFTANPKGESSFDVNDIKQTSKKMMNIGKQLEFQLGLEGVTSKIKALRVRVASKILKPKSLETIEKDLGLEIVDVKWLFDASENGGIHLAQSLDARLLEIFEKKKGKGWYEAIMLLANTSGTGIGGKRKAIYKTAEDARKLADKIKTSKTYKEISRADSNRQGDKTGLMKYVGFLTGGGEFNKANIKKAYNHGETNKKNLKEIIEEVKKLRDNKEIDHRHVRAFLEVAGGPMTGILRKSASLAVIPKGTPKELFEIWPEFIEKLDADGNVVKYKEDILYKSGKNKGKIKHKKGDAVLESGWVLEHTIPTQYVKARIYEYILSGTKEAKEAMDLTLRDFHTTFIPKQLDLMVNKLYLSELPPEFLPGMDPLEWRYYRNAYPFDFNIALEKVHGERKRTYDLNPTFTQSQIQARARVLKAAHVKLFGNIGLKQAVNKRLNSENLISAAKVDKALANGRKKQKKRGMSTWDLDDTLIHSKSGVRAKVPNTDGKPKPNRKVIFLAGGAGSGKGNVVKKLNLEKQGFKIVNQDISLEWLKKNHGLPENMNDLTKEQRSTLGKLQHQARQIAKNKMMKYKGDADGVVVDGTGGSIKAMEKLVNEFKDKGYDVSMVFVETSLETALARNRARAERSLLDKIVEKNHEAVQGNKSGFKTMFGERFMEVKTDNLKQEDAMPIDLVGKMNDFVSGYEKIRLDAEQFATQGKEILDKGGEFDFTEFNVVTGGEKGPFFQKALDRVKKYGPKDNFVLTARPPEAQAHIHEFLKSQGLNIPLENIKGLGNSTAEAKALWMLEKFSEGYNDMYFADDAMQNVKAVRSALDKLKVKSKIVQAKIQKEKSLNDVKNVDRLDSPDLHNKILYSRNLRTEYEKTIAKHRPDLVKEKLVAKTVDEMFDFIDTLNVPANKKKKYEQVTTKWLATSNIKLKEDAYKVRRAVELAEKHKEDIFSYRNPNEIIEKYAGKSKAKPTNPKTVKEFRFSGSHKEKGISIYEVENTKEGQKAVRKVIDTHWGIDSNPWCITQAKKGKLTDDAWQNWTVYEKGPKRIVFHNGKLSSFYANRQYWDRMDNATDAPTVTIKKGNVTSKVELVPYTEGGVTKIQEFVRETRTVSKDKKTVTTEILAETQDGYEVGTKIIENRINGITVKSTRSRPGFDKQGNDVMHAQEIINFDKSGKATSNITFDPSGNTMAINTHFYRDMSVNDIVMKKGDLLSHEVNEAGFDYYHGDILLNGKIIEIGWQAKEGTFDLKNAIKTVDGKVRVDLKKVVKADPNAKGIPSGKTPFKLGEVLKSTIKPQVKEGMQALEPVKKVLDQLDVKSEVQITRQINSENLSKDVNDIMEHSLGINSKKRFSTAEGKVRGRDKKRRKFFIPDSAADLELLIEPLLGKGKQGIENRKWFNENFHKPFERGINDLNNARQTILNDYMSLRKDNKDVVKSLDKPVEGTNFTADQAARVYIWNKAGFEAPGLTKTSKAKLLEYVTNNPKLQAFAESVAVLTKIETGLKQPGEYWWAETLATEVSETGRTIGRDKYIGDWLERKKEIFSEENLAKMESELGPRWREAIDGMLYRMETGRMRAENLDRLSNEVMDYLNGATGAIMHLNTRSAALQLISTVNFINHGENNPFAAARAFANLPQYTKDFMFIMNSPMLKQRRAGLQINVSEAELAAAASSGKKGGYQTAKRMLATILKHGYLPTKIADSFAIASGGATYYRNRIKMYERQGLKTKEAEKKAWIDFQAVAERTQQSSRPDLLSQQQVSVAGRLVLPFGNTPMQMNRIGMKEVLDVSKGRYDGWFGENSFTHKMSKISYYWAIQSAIFAGLQSAAFAVWTMGDDEPLLAQKKVRAANTMLDSFLRGMGIGPAVLAGMKNAVIKFAEQNKKGFNADYSEVGEALLNISPTIGSKFSGMDASGNTYKYNKKDIHEKGISLDNTSGLEATAQTIQAITNAPTYNYFKKHRNIEAALDEQNAMWQRFHNIWGYSPYDVGVADYQKKKKGKKEKKIETGRKPFTIINR